ncbi:DsbA family protein [Propioniciclava sinopodophylli]|uniref:DsbA family protein n=1 Tax=Propioniciclava sinopodophylli TaxID=1837344 RepID=UPI0024911AF2|nr:thioredoxin domain-containing protein [Propioniciclava sinopodophylli]
MPKQPKTNHPNTPSTPPTGSRREELAAQNARDARDRRIRWRVGLILTLTAMAVLVFAGIWIAATAPPRPAPTTATTPGSTASGQDTFTVGVGQPDAPVRVDVYQDFMCPYCQRFEQANGPALEQLVDAGTIRLEIHPMSFLDRASQGARYSTRAANAFVTVARADPDRVLAFNRALYDNQPAEGTTGLTDSQLATLAREVGVDPSVTDTFGQLGHEQWVAEGTQADFASGITGTPSVLIDGEPFTGDLLAPGALQAAIQTAAND